MMNLRFQKVLKQSVMLPRNIKLLLVAVVIGYAMVTVALIAWISTSTNENVRYSSYRRELLNSHLLVDKYPQHFRHYLQFQSQLQHLAGSISTEAKPVLEKLYFHTIQNISIISAYYDDRVRQLPVVRIIAISALNSRENLVCAYKDLESGPWYLAVIYEMCENHGKDFGGYIFTCNIPKTFKDQPRKVYLRSLSSLSGKQTMMKGEVISLDIPVITNSHLMLQRLSQITNDTPHLRNPINIEQTDARSSRTNSTSTSVFSKGNTQADNIPQKKLPNGTLKDSTSNFQINRRQNNGTKYKLNGLEMKLAICVPPLYGNIALSPLIQFIELAKLQGVSQLIFYKTNVTFNVLQFLHYYEDQGDVTLIDWKLPPHLHGNKLWYHGQLPAIQDCLYRNMDRYSYIAFIDIDEVIIPKLHFTWQEMLYDLEMEAVQKFNDSPVSGFSFESAFFNPYQAPLPPYTLSLLQKLQRNEVRSAIRRKLIVKADHVFEMGIHHISKTLLVNQSVTAMDVDPDLAIVQHYQKCNMNFDPRMVCEETVEDSTILKYADQLQQNYNNVLDKNIHKLR